MELLEFLTGLFGENQTITLDDLKTAVSQNKDVKFVDLKDGGYVDEGKFKGVEGQLATANQTIKDLQETVKKYDGKDPDQLAKDLADLQAKYDADTASLRLNAEIDKRLISANVKNPVPVRAMLDMNAIKLDGDKLTGLDDQLEALRKTDDYLFKPTEQEKTSTKMRVDSAGEHSTDGNTSTPSSLLGALQEHYQK